MPDSLSYDFSLVVTMPCLIYVYNLIAKSNIEFLTPFDLLIPHVSELQR